ncbi:hypothetical protein BVY04_00675, partial [bacterium M21]
DYAPASIFPFFPWIKLGLAGMAIGTGVWVWRGIRDASIWLDEFRCPGCKEELGHLVAGKVNLTKEQALACLDEISCCPLCQFDLNVEQVN